MNKIVFCFIFKTKGFSAKEENGSDQWSCVWVQSHKEQVCPQPNSSGPGQRASTLFHQFFPASSVAYNLRTNRTESDGYCACCQSFSCFLESHYYQWKRMVTNEIILNVVNNCHLLSIFYIRSTNSFILTLSMITEYLSHFFNRFKKLACLISEVAKEGFKSQPFLPRSQGS